MPRWLIDRYHDNIRTVFAEGEHHEMWSLGSGVVIGVDEDGVIMWIEIVNASRRVRNEGLRDAET